MKKYLIWGTGKVAEEKLRRFQLTSLNDSIEIIGFIDNNPKRHSGIFHNIKIYAPADINNLEHDFIDIWVVNGVEDIEKQVKSIGISDEKIQSVFWHYKQKILDKYADTSDEEIKSFLHVMERQKEIHVYSYNPTKQYEIMEALYDRKKDLYYVDFEGKRLYLAKNYEFIIKDEKRYVSNLWQEQDENSPHLYAENRIIVEEGDVLVDAGACEGNFSLHNIDKISKLYLVESDLGWIEALKATFEPYKDKVIFCNKFLCGYDSDNTITLNSLVKEPVNFIKMDIEGGEVNALKSADKVFGRSSHIKCAICAYHKHGDEEKIKNILKEYGLDTSVSKGYMLFICDDEVWKNPELRRGVVRGRKQ